jgi:glycosyltransferase involved in cell wall biosynthesis
VERYVHELALGLRDRHGHDVSVVTTANGPGLRQSVISGLRVVALPVRFRVSATPFNPAWFVQLRGVIAAEGPDTIITHAPVPGLADVCLASRGRVPAIATYHAGSMRKHNGRLVDTAIAAYESAVLPAILHRADAVVTTYPTASACGVDSRYVPPGVDVSLFSPSPHEATDGHRVLYAGRIEHASAWKGIDVLLHAVVELAGRFPDVSLRLAGGGDAVDHYRQMATALGISGRVTFTGPLLPAQLAAEYRRAAVTVLPSVTDAEAFGMVLIESMACGTPVVASRVGGMPMVVVDTGGGLLAEPGDSGSLAKTVGSLLADPSRRARLAAAGRRRVLQRYRWERVADAFEELIDVVGARPSVQKG